ncbi:DNA polymerase III subunit chi [Martelella sp. AD-3]|uniref:DNA polymerase III subunit chi n=1 Tax=Martelella sp. AD-3 TaxID=686597 RepID=UPI000467A157|nr:DNA polymerase III subunit chi [Martelella sp. AD-3]AMM84699.1 DNA polymerase III subunit chi [Martelella sp. AD-3]
MTEILFYHLTESLREAALPPLVEKSLERGWRVAIQTASEAERDRLDGILWTFRADSFIPHGTDAEDNSEAQPVLLTTAGNNANRADIRFFVEGAEVRDVGDYSRVVVMFDGHDGDELTRARAQWKALRQGDHSLTYWQQGEGGRWQKKA